MFFEGKIIPKSFENEIENMMGSNTTPWYFQSSTLDIFDYPHIDGMYDTSQFTHLILKPNHAESFVWQIVRPVLFFIEKELDIHIKSIQRCKANLLVPNKNMGKDNFHPPHHDGYDESKKILSALYYVNDSDGDTFFFDAAWPSTPENMTITKRVSPEKGKVVVFDAPTYHASSPPIDSERRIVLNWVFEV